MEELPRVAVGLIAGNDRKNGPAFERFLGSGAWNPGWHRVEEWVDGFLTTCGYSMDLGERAFMLSILRLLLRAIRHVQGLWSYTANS